jgi:hypothetical protein
MLQAERSQVRLPMTKLNICNIRNPSSLVKDLGFTQPLTNEYHDFPWGGKARPAFEADNLAATFESTV